MKDDNPLSLQKVKELFGATRQLSQWVFVSSKKAQGEMDAVKVEVDSLTQSLADARRKVHSRDCRDQTMGILISI